MNQEHERDDRETADLVVRLRAVPLVHPPSELRGRVFYRPGDWGFEQKMRERLADIDARRRRDGQDES